MKNTYKKYGREIEIHAEMINSSLKKNSREFHFINEALKNRGQKIRIAESNRNTCWTAKEQCRTVCKKMGFKFECSNDAPKGGVAGDYLIIF